MDPDSLLWYCDIQLEPGVNIVNAYAYKGDAQGKSYLAQIYYTGKGPGLTLHVHPDANGVYQYMRTASCSAAQSQRCWTMRRFISMVVWWKGPMTLAMPVAPIL